jgi:hypothetical protein
MCKREKQLVHAATKALTRLADYREKHGLSVGDHIFVSARLAGWPAAGAREAADLMTARGIHPLAAQRAFGASERYCQ